jgi:hypothetical protein
MAHPYLMHGMPAVSATHLKHLSPADLAESYHWQRSLKLLREELGFKLGTHNTDPIISTSWHPSISKQVPNPRILGSSKRTPVLH